MMSDLVKVTTMTAASMIDGQKVLSMRATIAEDGTVSFGKTIRNTELYLANLAQCDADCDAFESKVREAI